MADTIDFPEFAPDLSTLGTGVSSIISGAVPQADGYGPFGSLADLTRALPAGCRGHFFARKDDGSIAVFAGTIDRLYLLNNGTFEWADVSQGGIAYSALSADAQWVFRQFNDLVLAVQGGTVPQKYVLPAGPTFVDLGGSPPIAKSAAIINRFVVLVGIVSNPRRVQWSDLDGPEVWTAGVGLADYEDLPDGGSVHAITGGDAYGLVFQDDPVRSFVYNPGSPTTFQITKIAEQDPIFAIYSVVQGGDRSFYLSAQGFKMVAGVGGQPQPIGKERVDRFFFRDVDRSALRMVIGAVDPQATRFYCAYKSQQGQADLFDKVLCYDWTLKKWSLLPVMGEYLAGLAKPGLTLEQLDAIAPTPLPVTDAVDNGAGLIRLEFSGGLSNSDFAIPGQNFIVVQGVTGTVEANGTWAFNVIDATHIDLVGSAFVNPYVSGGQVGGSLDALPFSLDSVSTAAIAAISAVTPSHIVGFFTGPNMEAIIETAEQDAKGSLVWINRVMPLTDCADGMISLSGRLRAQDAAQYTEESAIGVDGWCPQLLETRYAKARLRNPAGSTWTYARGVQPDGGAAGDR